MMKVQTGVGNSAGSPRLPSFDFNSNSTDSILSPPTCRWKDVYIRAHHLELNWAHGRYTVAPVLRGHKEPINAMACDGGYLCFLWGATFWGMHSECNSAVCQLYIAYCCQSVSWLLTEET